MYKLLLSITVCAAIALAIVGFRRPTLPVAQSTSVRTSHLSAALPSRVPTLPQLDVVSQLPLLPSGIPTHPHSDIIRQPTALRSSDIVTQPTVLRSSDIITQPTVLRS